MSSFTAATFEKVYLADGRPKTREGRQIYRIRGATGDGLTFDIGYKGSGLSIHLDEGTETDGPSRPTLKTPGWRKIFGLVTWLIPQWVIELAMKSSGIHDKLCDDVRFDSPAAAAIFLTAMYAEGTPAFWRELFFDAVRVGGPQNGGA